MEEEYQLLDPETFDLVQHIDTMLAAVTGHELEARINAELMQSVLEIATPGLPQRGRRDALADDAARLRHGDRARAGHARRRRPELTRSASSSGSASRRRTATSALIDQLQYVARRELIFGMHVHVAVDDPEKAIQVVNGLLPHLAPLLALSASSPFWRGEATGLASSRQMVFSAFPRSGPPPRFRDYADYASVVGQLERSGCIADYTHIWWDIRLAPAPRHDRDPHLRRGHSRGGRGRDRRVLPGAREAALRAARGRARRSRRTTASSRARTSGSRRGTGSRRR